MEAVANVEACRLCANLYMTGAEVDFINIFQPIDGLQGQLEFIKAQLTAWDLQISPDDGLPQRMCTNCFVRFCNIEAFRQECEQAQGKLRQSSTTSNEPVEVEVIQSSDTTNTSTEIIAGLECISVEAQLPFKSSLTKTQASSAMLNSGNTTLITTNALLDTQPVETYALDFPTVSAKSQYFTQQELQDPAFDKEPDYIVQSKSMETDVGQIVPQDLEDMLQGSIIPTKANDLHANIIEEVESEAKLQKEIKIQDDLDINYSSSEDDLDETEIEPEADIDGNTTRISSNHLACQYCYCPTMGAIDHLIFPNSEALSQHFFEAHDPNLPYTCPYCPQKYNSVKQRDYHVRLMHSIAAETEECEYCHKKLRGPIELHQYNCQHVGNWECGDCGDKFVQIPLHRFRIHQKQHETNKQYRCGICDRLFVRRANLEAHERLHRIQAATMTACSECKAVFSGNYELRRHKYQMHNGELPVKCEYCSKGFVSIAFLSRHLQHFHPEKLDANNAHIVNCTNCGTSFSSLHKLRNHVQRPRDENGKCVDVVQNNNNNFKERRRLQRQGAYACHHCSKRFHAKSQLEKHLNTHDKQLRPYQCNQCTVRCRNSTELRHHNNTVHLNEQIFDCEECGEHFGSRRDLQQHTLTHKRFKVHCIEAQCNFICESENALNEHIRAKHRFIPCEYCGECFSRARLNTHLRSAHPAEVGVEIAEPNVQSEEALAINSILEGAGNYKTDDIISTFNEQEVSAEKVRVELLNSHSRVPTFALQEQPVNTYKSLVVGEDTNMANFFMDSLLDPDNEIIVT